jgi:hypothetical protein
MTESDILSGKERIFCKKVGTEMHISGQKRIFLGTGKDLPQRDIDRNGYFSGQERIFYKQGG